MLEGVRNLKYLAKGKRSKVYIGDYKRRKVAIKISNKAKVEGEWLKLLNKYKIGPKLLYFDYDKIVYEFVEGDRIGDYLKKKSINKNVLKKSLLQCRILDKLKINKKELTNPYEHILIKNNKAIMIDFERCYKSKNPKNITQFCQYLIKKKILDKKVIKLLKRYKREQNEKNFKEILLFLSRKF